ncbi:hypothetical protein Efla_004122 [Eimeria flavescens]
MAFAPAGHSLMLNGERNAAKTLPTGRAAAAPYESLIISMIDICGSDNAAAAKDPPHCLKPSMVAELPAMSSARWPFCGDNLSMVRSV